MDPLFLHELALKLGMPVREMCRRMSLRELNEWVEYFAYERRVATEAAKEQGGQ